MIRRWVGLQFDHSDALIDATILLPSVRLCRTSERCEHRPVDPETTVTASPPSLPIDLPQAIDANGTPERKPQKQNYTDRDSHIPPRCRQQRPANQRSHYHGHTNCISNDEGFK